MDPSYNNSFGSAGNAANSGVNGLPQMEVPRQQAISSGSGDVVLSSPKGDAGKRRWPIVVVAMLCVVAIAAGVGAVIAVQRGRRAWPAFDAYANYVLYGKESDDSVKNKTYDSSYEYFFEMLPNGIEGANIISRIREYQVAFDKTVGENETDIKTVLDSQGEYLDFAAQVLTKDFVTQGDVFAVYMESGQDGARSAFDNYYGEVSDDETLLMNYINSYKTWLAGEIDLFNYYSNHSCIDSHLNNECLASNMSGEEWADFNALREEVTGEYVRLNSMRDIGSSFVENVFEIKNMIYNNGGVVTNNTNSTGGADE